MTQRESELRAMFSLAAPLVLTELGWMAMGIVDTMFVGRVSAEAIGAVSLAAGTWIGIKGLSTRSKVAWDVRVGPEIGGASGRVQVQF